MSKLWILFSLFLINQAHNEKCCDPKTQTCNEEQILKVIISDSTDDSTKSARNSDILDVNLTETIAEKEKPSRDQDEIVKMVNPAPVENKFITSPLPAEKPNLPINKHRPQSIKLTKSGSIYFMKNLEDAISKHPVLSKNENLIKELLNDAIANATEALRVQQKEAMKIAVKLPDTGVFTKSDCAKKTDHNMNAHHIQTKKKIPFNKKVIEIPHKLNETKVIFCQNNDEQIKSNTSVFLKHDDGLKHVNLLNNTITVKQENECPTQPKQMHVAESELEEQATEVNITNAGIYIKKPESTNILEPKITATAENDVKKQGSRTIKPKTTTLLHPIELHKLKHTKICKEDPVKTRNKLMNLVDKKLTIVPTVTELEDKNIDLPLFEDEVDVISPEIIDIDDQVYEETYAKAHEDAKLDSNDCLHSKRNMKIWYPDYYQTYGQNPNYPSYSNTYNPNTHYMNPSTYYNIEEGDNAKQVAAYEQNYNAYKNYLNASPRQKDHNEIVKKCWWNRKIHFRNGADEVNNKMKCGKNLNTNPYYKQFKY